MNGDGLWQLLGCVLALPRSDLELGSTGILPTAKGGLEEELVALGHRHSGRQLVKGSEAHMRVQQRAAAVLALRTFSRNSEINAGSGMHANVFHFYMTGGS